MTMTSGTERLTGTSETVSAYRELFFPCAPPLYEQPLVLAEGRGAHVFDVEGAEYLDFFSGILTTSVGHCHRQTALGRHECRGTGRGIAALWKFIK